MSRTLRRVIENPEILPGEDGTRLDDQIVGFRTAAGSLAAGASMGQAGQIGMGSPSQ